MVIDSSALIAILLNEPERRIYSQLIRADVIRLLSAATLVEASIVLRGRYGTAGGQELDALIERVGMQLIPVSLEQAYAARSAFEKYGKGIHPARLNFGDCFSYALAKVSGEPLLHKGRDFGLTDLALVISSP